MSCCEWWGGVGWLSGVVDRVRWVGWWVHEGVAVLDVGATHPITRRLKRRLQLSNPVGVEDVLALFEVDDVIEDCLLDRKR